MCRNSLLFNYFIYLFEMCVCVCEEGRLGVVVVVVGKETAVNNIFHTQKMGKRDGGRK